MLKRIHINKHIIRANKKHGRNDPPITVKTYKANIKSHEVEILGPSVLMHSPDKPLSCGAVVWLETESFVRAYTGHPVVSYWQG